MRISDWSSDVCSSDLVDASPLTAEQRVAGDRDILEINLRRAVAVDRRIVAADDAGQRRVDQEQRHAATVALTAAGAPGAQLVRRSGNGRDDDLVAVYPPARPIPIAHARPVR